MIDISELSERVNALEIQQAVSENSLETLADGFHEMSDSIKGLTESINQGKGILWTIVAIFGTVDLAAIMIFFASK